MTITLTPEQEKLVQARVDSGRYLNAEHLAAEALKLLSAREDHEEEFTALRDDIEAGWMEAEKGQLLNGPETMAALLRRAESRLP